MLFTIEHGDEEHVRNSRLSVGLALDSGPRKRPLKIGMGIKCGRHLEHDSYITFRPAEARALAANLVTLADKVDANRAEVLKELTEGAS